MKNEYLNKLKKCCAMRGLPQELMHRTIHEFPAFTSSVIFDKSSKEYEFGQKNDFHYDKENTLEAWIDLFYKWCKKIYVDEWQICLDNDDEENLFRRKYRK